MSTGVANRHVLVIKLGALGDVALSLPHIAHIQQAHSADQVTLLTAPEYADLAAGIPQLNVVVFRRRGFFEMCRLLSWLFSRRFDTVYDLQGSFRSRVMTWVTRAGKRVGASPGLAYTHTPSSMDTGVHAFNRFNTVLQAGGIGAASPGSFPAGLATASGVNSWLHEHGMQDKRLVLIHAGSSRQWPAKRWGEDNFLLLAKALDSRGLIVVWVGGEDERELNTRLANYTGVDATACFSYRQLVALGGHAEFAITGDSGPMHLFSAAGLPVYAFFGPTDWRRSHALGQEARVLFNPVPCSPCHLPVCPPERQHVCMQGLTPATVLERFEQDGLISREEG